MSVAVYCSFCGKSNAEVGHMFSGLVNACICDDCVRFAFRALERLTSGAHRSTPDGAGDSPATVGAGIPPAPKLGEPQDGHEDEEGRQAGCEGGDEAEANDIAAQEVAPHGARSNGLLTGPAVTSGAGGVLGEMG